MPVHVTVEAGDALARALGPPIIGEVELLLRKAGEQEPEAYSS